jgi:hypothetical protein
MVPVSGQSVTEKDLSEIMRKTARDCGIIIYGVKTGLTKGGIDLGSTKMPVLEKPEIALIAGDGTSSSQAGEIWHLLDERLNMHVTMITAQRFGITNLNRYNVIIITGSPDINPNGLENLKAWNRNGGTIIGLEGGNNWLNRNKLAEIEFVPAVSDNKKDGVYLNRFADNQARQIPGSIFQAKLDLTHPLCYGYVRDLLPVFKSSETVAKKDEGIYNNPVQYSTDPLLSGYCSKDNLKRIKGSPFASVHGTRIISLYDDPNFRAFWYGTNKIFLNAIFFGQIIR